MGNKSNLETRTKIAGADLRTSQYLAVKLNSSGEVVLAGAGEVAYGILQNNPNAGQAATVAVWGVSLWKTASVIAPGALVTPDAAGKCVTATPGAVKTDDAGAALDDVLGSFCLGQCVEKANTASGDLVSVEIIKAGLI